MFQACVLHERGTLLELVDPDLGSNYSTEEALMLNVGADLGIPGFGVIGVHGGRGSVFTDAHEGGRHKTQTKNLSHFGVGVDLVVSARSLYSSYRRSRSGKILSLRRRVALVVSTVVVVVVHPESE